MHRAPRTLATARLQLRAPRVDDAAAIFASYASDPDATRPYVRAHAQELDDDVCRRHIALYVNEYSASLGAEGRRAIEALVQRMRDVGAMPADAPGPWR